MKTVRILCMVLLSIAVFHVEAAEQQLRTWTFNSGKTIQARFVRVTNEGLKTAGGGEAKPTWRVILEREDGRLFGALYEALSDEDRRYVVVTLKQARSAREAESAPPTGVAAMSEDEYLDLPEKDIDLAAGSLIVARECHPDINIAAYLARVDTMAEDLRPRLEGKTDATEIIQAVNNYLFVEQEYEYAGGVHFLNEVLDHKHGSCVGLTTLYLSLADRLGLPCYGVDVPRHILVRYDSGRERFNVDPMAQGASVSDDWYMEELNIPESCVKNGIYLKKMSKKQVLASLLNNRGNVYREQGKPDLSLVSLDKAIVLNPNDSEAYYSRGQTYNDMEEYGKGLSDCTLALKLNPNEPRAYNNRAVARQHLGDLNGALEDYSKALALDPQLAGAYCNRAYVYMQIGDYRQALMNAEKAVKIEPDKWNHRFVRGSILSELGMLDRAIEDLNTAAALDPENSFTYVARGLTYARLGARDKTFADIRTLIAMMPEMRDYLRGLENFSQWHYDPEYQAIFEE